MGVELVDDERQAVRLDAARAQFLQHVRRGNDRADALIAHDPAALGGLHGLGNEINGRKPPEVGNLEIEEVAEPLDQRHRIRMRNLAHLREARRQRQHGHAARVVGQRGVQQRLVEPTQVAHAIDKAEAALGVQIKKTVAGRQPEIEQRHPMRRVLRP
jgi:hypothetical protein